MMLLRNTRVESLRGENVCDETVMLVSNIFLRVGKKRSLVNEKCHCETYPTLWIVELTTKYYNHSTLFPFAEVAKFHET